jgi:hypothetical protein
VKRKSLTSAWRRSTFSTRKTPEHPGPAYSLPGGEAADAVAAAAEAADAAGEPAEAAEAAEYPGVIPGEVATTARRKHFPTTLIDADRYGRALLDPATAVLFAVLPAWKRG